MLQEERSDLITHSTGILNTMFLLCKHLSLYSEDNSVVVKTTDKLMQALAHSHASGTALLVTVSKHGFLFHGEFLNQKNQLFSKFAQRMFQHGISSFTLTEELTVPSLYAFLKVIMRNGTDTWDEGGIGACLQTRNIIGLQITEMSERDFRLLDSVVDQDQINEIPPTADLWNKFAHSIFNALTGGEQESPTDGEITPAELADRVSEHLVGKSKLEKEVITQELTRFAATLQREKTKTVRAAALANLADLINHLSDDLRQAILSRICNLQMTEDYAEDFFNGLTNKAILDAFRETTMKPGYTPPVVMALINKLAGSRKLVSEMDLAIQLSANADMAQNVKELFRPDEFKKYVPSRYQNALMQVLNNQQVPSALSSKLQSLKASLEDSPLGQKMGRLAQFILENNPDENLMEGLRNQLIGSMQFHLDAVDYPALVDLCRTCFVDKTDEKTKLLVDLIPDSFMEQVLGDASRFGKDHQMDIAEVVALIGPPFINPLIECINLETDRSTRYFYLERLKRLGPQIVDHIAFFLQDERWFVQRNMLSLLGELGAADKLSKIKPLLKHSHQKVRQEALKTCLLLRDEDSIQELVHALSSENRQDRLHAITLSKLVNHPKLATKLLAILKTKTLFRFDFDIKKALVHTLAEHKNAEALGVFSNLLKSRKLFQASSYKKFKLEIIKVLPKYPATQVVPLLRQQLNSGTKEAADQARQILAKLSVEDAQ
ncbi:HEAT repeat domain-containing protein [Geopsychrobacter electrodiphilus]|uniref:HEAT repeat domain-containing protein n=1 Tax=Geopsychrobacter electrodiphilus TaxID=225196 RepID=UPI00035F652B|nr:HEAT repeat domain-containing protein [Geopsychrobacter electrodiphilus]